jgi:hypothetical protein
MSKGNVEYEARVLNALTEPGAKRHAYKKVWKYQDSKAWVFSSETNEWNTVSDAEDLEREIYFGLSIKIVAILASDKRGVFSSVETLADLASTDPDTFNGYYKTAIEANPSLAEKEDVLDPNA